MAPLGSPRTDRGADSREVLCFIADKQMQINNFSGCVFIRQALPFGGAKERAMHMENKYANSIFINHLGTREKEQRSVYLKMMYNHKRS